MSSIRIKIGNRLVGLGAPALLIAEVGQAHDGSLGAAHAFIDASASAGADAIKFQTHIAAEESTLDEEFRVKFSKQDKTRYDYWQRMEFSLEQWAGLSTHAAEKNLIFLSSAFSVAAVEMLSKLDHPAWKIGSGEYKSSDLIMAMAKTGRPILLSTGMSNRAEITSSVKEIRSLGVTTALFQCTSQYPTPLEKVGLNVIEELRTEHKCPVGLSDHSGSLYPAIAALARGANLIEVHVTFDHHMFGPDVPASLNFKQFKQLSDARNAFWKMDQNPVDKDTAADELENMRVLFTKSLAPTHALTKGTVLTAKMLTAKKPGTGIAASKIHEIIGRTLRKDVGSRNLLRLEDLK